VLTIAREGQAVEGVVVEHITALAAVVAHRPDVGADRAVVGFLPS
jgi:hypothetical protein